MESRHGWGKIYLGRWQSHFVPLNINLKRKQFVYRSLRTRTKIKETKVKNVSDSLFSLLLLAPVSFPIFHRILRSICSPQIMATVRRLLQTASYLSTFRAAYFLTSKNCSCPKYSVVGCPKLHATNWRQCANMEETDGSANEPLLIWSKQRLCRAVWKCWYWGWSPKNICC